MNDITIILWITIALIAIIAIILVKLHYRSDELENDEGPILPSSESINNALNAGKSLINTGNQKNPSNEPPSLSPKTSQQNSTRSAIFGKTAQTRPHDDSYIVPKVEENNLNNYEYESQNQVLINYDNTVEKFQEPIKQSQIDIMTQKDTTELKDLFTIDELIKESKRKDDEREKESQQIKREDDAELDKLKESIKNKTEEPLIEEIISEEEKEEEKTDAVSIETKEETPSVASQKDVDEAIKTAANETKEEIESISEDKNITDALLNEEPKEEISEPQLKTPSKVDDTNLSGEEEEGMDLDYRKDLDKFAKKIKGTKIYQEVKEKIITEPEETPDESYIRNVNEYDEYAPIINETHIDLEADYDELHKLESEERLRQANTKRIFEMNKESSSSGFDLGQPKSAQIKNKPERANIKITINDEEQVLKKGDEIIFKYSGDTYSSQVFAINGDDISVKYRRKKITIKPSDVKKIY